MFATNKNNGKGRSGGSSHKTRRLRGPMCLPPPHFYNLPKLPLMLFPIEWTEHTCLVSFCVVRTLLATRHNLPQVEAHSQLVTETTGHNLDCQYCSGRDGTNNGSWVR